MTARLHLLCHAATAATRTAAFPAGEPADAAGLRRIDAVARDLPACRYWLTSPEPAAVQTAAALRPKGASVEGASLEPALRDCDFGRWTGQPFDSVQAAEPEAVAAWLQDPDAAPHGGESLAALLTRVAAWLAARQEVAGATLAVTHVAVIRAAVVLAIEAGPRSFWRIDVAPLTLARLSGQAGRWTLVSLGPAAP